LTCRCICLQASPWEPPRPSSSTGPTNLSVLYHSIASGSRSLNNHEGDTHDPSHHLVCSKRRAGSERRSTASAHLRFASRSITYETRCSDFIGWNYSPTSKDNEAISRAYQDVDVELFSPAFLRPETIPVETFVNGTSGPTNETTLGMQGSER